VKISCPACAAKYSIADEKVQDRLAKIRCRKCGTTIVIDGKVQPINIYAADGSMPAHSDAAAADAGGGGEYSVDLGDNDQRTMSLHDLMEAYNAGTVTAETYLWTEGMADWKPLSEFPEIVDALHQAASHPAVPAAPAAAPSPWDGGAAARPQPSPARAASRDSRRAGSADLFGSLDTAGSESDSFGIGAGHDAPVPVATGARNESSVLFSLSALTSAAQKPAPATASKPTASVASSSASTSASSAMKEDSGLIDLKALTAAAKPEAEAPMIAPAPLGLGAPLGFHSPPLGAGVSAQMIDAPLMPPPKNRTGLFIGAGIAVAVIGAALILRPSEAPPEQTQPTVAAPAPTPTPTPTPTEAMLAKPPATGTADDSADGGKPKVAASKRRYGGGARSKGGTGTAPAPDKGGDEAAKPAAKKPSGGGGCGCAADDLMCNMRCSSGKK